MYNIVDILTISIPRTQQKGEPQTINIE